MDKGTVVVISVIALSIAGLVAFLFATPSNGKRVYDFDDGKLMCVVSKDWGYAKEDYHCYKLGNYNGN